MERGTRIPVSRHAVSQITTLIEQDSKTFRRGTSKQCKIPAANYCQGVDVGRFCKDLRALKENTMILVMQSTDSSFQRQSNKYLQGF